MLCSVHVSYLDGFIKGALGTVVLNIFNSIYPVIKSIFSVLSWMILGHFKRSELFASFSNSQRSYNNEFYACPLQRLKCLLAVVGNVSALVVEATGTFRVTKGRQMTNTRFAPLSSQVKLLVLFISPVQAISRLLEETFSYVTLANYARDSWTTPPHPPHHLQNPSPTPDLSSLPHFPVPLQVLLHWRTSHRPFSDCLPFRGSSCYLKCLLALFTWQRSVLPRLFISSVLWLN